MADRVVSWKALADFSKARSEARATQRDYEKLREEETRLNESSARSSAKADAADQKRIKTRKEESSSLRDVVSNFAKYRDNVKKSAEIAKQAGGAAKVLADAQREQAKASRDSEAAADRLARAQQRLAQIQQSAARDLTQANASRARSANQAERAALSLAAAEQKLAEAQKSSSKDGDAIKRAELALSDARLTSAGAAQRLEDAESKLQRAKQRSSKDNDSIVRAERTAAAAASAAASAVENLAKKSARVDDVFQTLSSSGGGLGGILGSLEKGIAGFASALSSSLPMLIAFAVLIPVILSAVQALISGIVALGAAAYALVAAMSPVVGILGALPGAIATAGLAIGTLMLAFKGIGEAVKESTAAQKNAGKVAKDSAKAQRQAARQVADAYKSLRNAKEAQARGEVAANRAVRDARRNLDDALQAANDAKEQASRNLVSAERGLVDAQENSRRAQQNLTKARQDAVRNLKDLKNAVEDIAIQEDRSALSLAQAKERLQQVLSDPNATDLEKTDAELAVKEAMAALRDTKQQAEDTRKEYVKAQKQGVEKSDAVVQAKKDEADAILSLKDAQRALSDAAKQSAKTQVQSARSIQAAQESLADAIKSRSLQQRDGAEAVAQAQLNLKDAYEAQKDAANTALDATQKLRDAMADLTPEGRAFVKLLLSLKPVLDGIKQAAEKGLFPGLGAALKTFAELAPIITPAVQKMGTAIGGAAQKLADLTKDPLFRDGLAKVLDSSVKIMDKVGTIIANLVSIFLNVAVAARPFTEWLADTTVKWTEQWKAMTSGKKGQKKLTDFFSEAKETLQVVGGLLLNFVKVLLGIGKASKGVGKQFLKSLADSMKSLSDFVNSKEGQARIKKWFEDMAPVAKSIALAVKDLTLGILKLANDPKAKDFFETLRTKFIPAFLQLLGVMGSGAAEDTITILTAITKMSIPGLKDFRDFVDLVAYFVDLLPGDSNSTGGVGSFVKNLLDSLPGIGLLHQLVDILGGLKALIQWFSGEDDTGSGGGSWGDESPLHSFGSTIDWLGKKLKEFLHWIETKWWQFYDLFIAPPTKAYNWLLRKAAEFGAWFLGKLLELLTWIKNNWSKILGYLTDPVGSALRQLGVTGAGIKKFFSDLWDNITLGAGKFVTAFGQAIDKIKAAFADPVSFVINTVINGALIDGFNYLANKITGGDSLKIDHIDPPKFATGGIYPGYTPGRDIGMVGVSGGEAIMRPEWTRAVGKGEVNNMNAAARRGGKKGVLRYLGGFKKGGAVEGGGGGSGDFAATSFRGKKLNFRTIKMLLAAEKLYGSQFRITQGSYSTSVAASGDTHAGGGVFDLGWTGANSQVTALRRVGFAAWHRNRLQGPWNDHVHAVALGDPTESDAAKRQVSSYLAGGNGLGGSDDGPRVAIDLDLARQLGITDASIAAAQQETGSGGSLLSRLFGWVKSAAENPVKYLKDKISAPVQEMFNKFGNNVVTGMLSKVPEKIMGAMGDKITSLVGSAIDKVNPFSGGHEDVRKTVQQRANAYGWGDGGNWDALQWIINKESSWNPNAQNPNSTAYGLFQFLDGTWEGFGAKTSDPGLQTDYGLSYIKGRYGTPTAAKAFHESHGWYSSGGVVPQAFATGGHVGGVGNTDKVPAMLTPGEYVIRKDVAKKIGRRKLDMMNQRKNYSLKPTDAGIQAFHSGGPVLGMKRGTHGDSIRALRYLLSMATGAAPSYGTWDAGLDQVLRQPGAYSRLTGPKAPASGNPKRGQLLNYIRKYPGVSFASARNALRLNDAQMLKMWESVKPNAKKTIPAAEWRKLDQGYVAKRSEMYKYVGHLNSSIGLKSDAQTWTTHGRSAMKHILEHSYGRAHDPLEYRPWQYFTPVETAANNAIAANKKLGEFNGALEILSNWGLTDLVTDLLGQGVDQGYNVAVSASKNKAVATILNQQIMNQKLLTTEDQANVLKMVSLLAGGTAAPGLRDMARGLQLSDLDTVLLFEKAQKLGRLGKVPAAKLSRLRSDITSFRSGTFYAAGGGEVPGYGVGDTVPAMLTPGEYVLRKAAVKALGLSNLHALNAQRFGSGGLVQQFSLAGKQTTNVPGVRAGSMGQMDWPEGSHSTLVDIDIHNPVAEKSSTSLTKALQRQSVIKGINGSQPDK